MLAEQIFKLPHHKFRVVCDNMGGGFGMKGGCYPEYALALWAAEVIGRPVRWIAERCEGLLSDEQAAAASSRLSWRSTLTASSWRCGRAGCLDRRLLLDRPANDPADHRHSGASSTPMRSRRCMSR